MLYIIGMVAFIYLFFVGWIGCLFFVWYEDVRVKVKQ